MSSNFKYVSKARQKIKEDLVYIHGGKCIMCGYNKCMAALQFHHIKPEEKKFGLSNGQGRSWEETLKESKKCVLVCSNCHMEIHYEDFSEELKTSYIEERAIEITKERESKINKCLSCGKEISRGARYCVHCWSLINRKVERPSREELKHLIRVQSFLSISKLYGVCDNTIRKWCDDYNLPRKKTVINNYSDDEWVKI